MQPLAIYIHVPFCGQRCAYCHFDIKVLHPRTHPDPHYASYVAATCQELRFRARELPQRQVSSVFFGGGTPTRLPSAALSQILATIKERFSLQPNAEISLEANPEDVTPALASQLRQAGFTRVSLGIQSFDDRVLKAAGRPHSGAEAVAGVQLFRDMQHGVSFDLMLGLPFQTRASIERDLAQLAILDPQHVSVYMLERDLPTPLDKMADHLPMVDEDTQAAFYEHVSQFLQDLGYHHYEISNFAKPGFTCRHNLTYWQCGDYLGIGPAAVGRIGKHLMINASQLRDYLAAVKQQGHGCVETETWSEERLTQEQRVQAIRLAHGIATEAWPAAKQDKLAVFLEEGLLAQKDTRLVLTRKGKLLGNEVFEALV